nr:protein toll-like [Onthophagus taurus]
MKTQFSITLYFLMILLKPLFSHKKCDLLGVNDILSTSINLKHCSLNKISFDKKFKDVQILDVSFNDLEDVNNVFEYLINVKSLDLSHNKIKKLPEIINLTNLTTFHLNNNDINYFNEKVFSKLENLKSLRLDINGLPPKSFQTLINLNNLMLNVTSVLNLTSDVFKNNKLLNQINIYGGKCIFYKDSLISLDNLVTLVVKSCKIDRVPNEFFLPLKKLTKLNLIHVGLNNWDDFAGLQNLQFLDLTGNEIINLSPSNFNLPSLIDLNLSKNNMKLISPKSYFNTRNLKELNLKLNNLTEISGLDHLIKLEKINLSYNNISRYPNLGHIVSLKEIILKNNNLQQLSLNSIGFPKKTRLFEKFIDVSNNQLKRIETNNIHAILLETNIVLKLKINRNPFKCDDCTIFNAQNRANLHFEYNKNEFCDPQHLKCKLISHKQHYVCLKNCNCSLFPFNSTLEMDCSNLNITSTPNITNFKPFKLDDIVYNNFYVDLSENLIKKFVETDGFKNVTGLKLSKNNLEVINWLPNNLQILELNNNNLEYLDYTILKKLNLSKLNLELNPWSCDCNALNLTKLLKTEFDLILTNKTILCGNKKKFLEITEDLCPKIDQNHYLTSFLIVTSLVLTIICYITYKKIKNQINSYYKIRRYSTEFIYDAFLCYSYKNEDYVLNLVQKLEEEYKLRLCVHARDWIVGEFISKQIGYSIENSRRTLVVVSNEFLKSDWGKTEVIMAYERFRINREHLIIVILLDKDNVDDIQDDDWRFYLKKASLILKSGQKAFWKELKTYLK